MASFCRIPFFFFNDTATTEIYTLSLHDALPISSAVSGSNGSYTVTASHQYAEESGATPYSITVAINDVGTSEDRTTGLHSRSDPVFSLLLDKTNDGLESVSPTSFTATFSHANPR